MTARSEHWGRREERYG
jgi:hypothetical protein